jgi:hypothetical protein
MVEKLSKSNIRSVLIAQQYFAQTWHVNSENKKPPTIFNVSG